MLVSADGWRMSAPDPGDTPVQQPTNAGLESKDATPITHELNRAALETLPFSDTRDFEDARRGFLGTLPEVEIKNNEGRVVWSLRDYASSVRRSHRQPSIRAFGAKRS